MTPSDYKQKLEQLKGQKRQLLRSIDGTKAAIRYNKQRSLDVEEAQRIIQYVARQTQEQLQFRISELVSMALAAVFEDPYTFHLEFVIRRGKTEADIVAFQGRAGSYCALSREPRLPTSARRNALRLLPRNALQAPDSRLLRSGKHGCKILA